MSLTFNLCWAVAPSSVCLRFLLILNQIKLIDVLAWFCCRCYCCMWIPFILDGLKNVIHTCPKCGSKLGEYTRFRMDRIWQKKKKHRQTQHNYTRGWQKNVWGRRYPCLWFDIKVPNIIIIWKHGNIKEILVTLSCTSLFLECVLLREKKFLKKDYVKVW